MGYAGSLGGVRYAEVYDLRVPGLGKEEVVRLDVPVDDALLVSTFLRLGDLHPTSVATRVGSPLRS
jgi:hypothetical protein